MIISPIISTAEGPCSRMATVASIDSTRPRKWTAAVPRIVGAGTRFTRASVTTASVPSDAPIIRVRFIGAPPVKSSRL